MWQGIIGLVTIFMAILLIVAAVLFMFALVCKRKSDAERAAEDAEQEKYLREYFENIEKKWRK